MPTWRRKLFTMVSLWDSAVVYTSSPWAVSPDHDDEGKLDELRDGLLWNSKESTAPSRESAEHASVLATHNRPLPVVTVTR